ncbi:hypothetical protein [Nannocystis exedens]|uniref:hypothetical protein n=1 Tax=Nannocystis exedens TaxID=54 RepID=UPI0011603C95|nr:hypothetical protein [Nannocystis exedens]
MHWQIDRGGDVLAYSRDRSANDIRYRAGADDSGATDDRARRTTLIAVGEAVAAAEIKPVRAVLRAPRRRGEAPAIPWNSRL